MARRILSVVILLACTSICWGQDATAAMTDMSMGESAQSATNTNGYAVTYSAWPAVTDGTAYLANNNAWKAMPVKTIISTSYLGGKMYVLDSAGCVFTYDGGTRTYTQKPWGCGWAEITTNFDDVTPSYMVGLLKTDAACPSGTKRFYWSYAGAAPTNTTVCAAHWYGSENGSQLQINRNSSNPPHTQYVDADGTYHDLGTGWAFGNVGPDSACLVPSANTKTLYVVPSGNVGATTPYLFTPAPPGGVAFTSCIINSDVIMVTTGATSYILDRSNLSSPSWKTVMGATSKLTGPSKGEIFGIVSGNLRHLNVYMGYISATLSGFYTGCPSDAQPCTNFTPTPVHTKSIQVHFPHGLNGAMGTFAGGPTATNTVFSQDYSPACDPFFGPFPDPECFSPVQGGVNCSVVNNSIYTPPPPPMCHDNSCQSPDNAAFSHDAKSTTTPVAAFSTIQSSGELMSGTKVTAFAIAKCEADVPACAPGTPPAPLICPAEVGAAPEKPYFLESARCQDIPPYSKCSETIVRQKALDSCGQYKHGWGYIHFVAGYIADDPAGPHCYPLKKSKVFAEDAGNNVYYNCRESNSPID